jgi:hypothetical protein
MRGEERRYSCGSRQYFCSMVGKGSFSVDLCSKVCRIFARFALELQTSFFRRRQGNIFKKIKL